MSVLNLFLAKNRTILKNFTMELFIYYLDNCRPLSRFTLFASRRYGQSTRFHVYQLVIYFYFLVFFVRVVIFGQALRRKMIVEVLSDWEPTFWQMKVAFDRLINSTTVFCIAPLLLYVAYLKYLLEFKIIKISITKLFADLFYYNTDNFVVLNFHFLYGKLLPLSPNSIFLNFKQIWSGKHDKRIQLKHQSLRHFPYASRHIRVQAALMAFFFEQLCIFLCYPGISK